jgi:hypothetical protein
MTVTATSAGSERTKPVTYLATPREPDSVKDLSGVQLYWLVFVVVTTFTCVFFAAMARNPLRLDRLSENAGVMVLVMWLPGIQLAAGVVALVFARDWTGRGRRARVQQVARIMVGALIGAAIGWGLTIITLPITLRLWFN